MGLDEEEFELSDEAAAARAGRRAFAPAEMVPCETCRRANAPTRLTCLYCGEPLPATAPAEALRRPALRAPEAWEQGFNVVLLPDAEGMTKESGDEELGEAAALLRLGAEQLHALLSARALLPLARTAERAEAELLERRLNKLGLPVEIVADEALGLEAHPPQRVRQLTLGDEWLAGRARVEAGERRVAWSDVRLVVAGRIYRKQIEVEERRKRPATSEVVETRELSEDESVLDIFAASPCAHWRVLAEGFDYSCLGAAKGPTAAENFKRLCEAVRLRAAGAHFDESYARVRHLLKFAWPPAEQRESRLRRARIGRLNTEAVTHVTNETQFTRYGRLLYHFASRPRATPATGV